MGCCWITDCVGRGVSIKLDIGIVTGRKEAIGIGRNVYLGKMCDKCGSTVRYVCNAWCVNCSRNKHRKNKGTYKTDIDPEKTKQRIEAKLEELALMRELDYLS